MRFRLHIFTIGLMAILIAVAAIGVVSATTGQAQKDVRITARLLENGKVEFGLQERTDGGDWSQILIPPRNKFPYATATVDRWLFSSAVPLTPVDIGAVQAPPSASHTLTVDEYAAGCAAQLVADPVGDAATWGEYITALDTVITELLAIRPPAVLADYHAVGIQIAVLVKNAAQEYPADAPVNVMALFGVALLAQGMLNAAEAALPDEVRATLIAGGCIED